MKRLIATAAALSTAVVVGLPAHALDAPAVGSPSSASAAGADLNEAAVTVNWNPVDQAVTYSVTASATGEETQTASTTCPVSPCSVTIGDLAGGLTYDFTVTAYDSNAVEASTTVQFVAKSIPDAPTVVSATAGVGQIALTWAAPANNGGTAITGYTVTSSDQSITKAVAGDATSVVVTGLTAGKAYTFRILAKNAIGSSAQAVFSQATVLQSPAAPGSVEARESEGTITATWSAPESDGGSDITSYTAYLRRDGADVGAPVVTGTTSASFSGVAAGEYTVQVLATNAAGSSPRSADSNSVDVEGASLLPNVPVFTPGSVADVEIGSNAIFTVSAAASSVITLSVSANPAGACTLSAGKVRGVAVGTCSVTASAAATSTHDSGTATVTFNIVATEETPETPDTPDTPSTPPSSGGGGFFPIPGSTPADPISTNPIPAGSSLTLVGANGAVVEVNPTVSEDAKTLQIVIGQIGMSLSASSGLKFSDAGQATVSSGTELAFAASGYQADSVVAGYLIPAATLSAATFVTQADSTISLGTTTVGQDGSFNFETKVNADPGSYILQFSGTSASGEEITLALSALVQGDQELAVWTKRLPGNTQAKLYAKSVVGVGKIQFFFNGREIAWVRAVDETDPKLRVIKEGPMTGANYLVRTVDLKLGKNVLEIYLDGERIRRTAYGRSE